MDKFRKVLMVACGVFWICGACGKVDGMDRKFNRGYEGCKIPKSARGKQNNAYRNKVYKSLIKKASSPVDDRFMLLTPVRSGDDSCENKTETKDPQMLYCDDDFNYHIQELLRIINYRKGLETDHIKLKKLELQENYLERLRLLDAVEHVPSMEQVKKLKKNMNKEARFKQKFIGLNITSLQNQTDDVKNTEEFRLQVQCLKELSQACCEVTKGQASNVKKTDKKMGDIRNKVAPNNKKNNYSDSNGGRKRSQNCMYGINEVNEETDEI